MLPNTRLPELPSQTAGPYVHIGLTPTYGGIGSWPDMGAEPFPDAADGERITISGRIFDGTGHTLRDALIETWQAGPDGSFGPGTRGWARLVADEDGQFNLRTVKPAAVGGFAPHIAVWIVARGINLGLQTRIYFPEDGEAQSADPLLGRIEHRDRIPTLIAVAEGPGAYRFDIRLQGEGETIFLDL